MDARKIWGCAIGTALLVAACGGSETKVTAEGELATAGTVGWPRPAGVGAPGAAGTLGATGVAGQGVAGALPKPAGSPSVGTAGAGSGLLAGAAAPPTGTGVPTAGTGGAAGQGSVPPAGAPTDPPGTGSESAGTEANGGEPRRPDPSKLPKVAGTCPELKDGTMTLAGTSFELWVGSKPGPMYLYWHATTQHADEVERALPKATADTKTKGGMVASFEATNRKGTNTANGVWYTGDFEAADQIVACGIEKGLIDTSRIYTAGYSAGGIQACAMVTTNGAYLAAAICYSGSAAVIRGTPKDPSNLPAVLLPHGAPGRDVLILDMAEQSVAWAADYTAAGGFAIDCMDGGDHLASASTRMGLDGHAMEFLDAHTYRMDPLPYATGLPATWPSYCKVVAK